MTQPRASSGTYEPLHRYLRWRLTAVIGIPALIAIVGTFFVLLTFNPSRYAPALVATLEGITGRQVTLSGPVTIQWSLTPALQANDITIANPPGFPQPAMLTLSGMRAEIALMPLFSHHIDILRLVLLSPRLELERLPDGRANWDFAASNRQPSANIYAAFGSNTKIALETVVVKDGLLTIDAVNGRPVGRIHFTQLTGTADSASAPLHLNAQAQIGTAPFTITGSVGPIERLSGIGSAPWPVAVNFALAGASLDVAGTIKSPRTASGYDLTGNLSIPDLHVLGQALPPNMIEGATLPAVQNISATLHVRDRGTPLPEIDNLKIAAGSSDLSAFRPGLILSKLSINMAGLDQPLSFGASGTSGSNDFSLQGQFGALQNLLNPAWLPAGAVVSGSFPISVTAQIGDANATLTGAIATPQTLSGAALAATATIPDLSTLSAFAGSPLPAWKHIALQASLIDPGGEGLNNAIGLDDLSITADNLSLGGTATLNLAPDKKLQVALNITQANLDGLLAALPPPPAAATPSPLASAAAPAPVMPPASPAPAVPPAPPILSASPLPLGFITGGNADIQLAANNVTWNGAVYTAVQTNITIAGNKLSITPFTVETPGGEITANASLDASNTPPAETLSINAPALALGPLLKSLSLPGASNGTLQFQLSASSTGNSPQAIAAGLTGQLGLASVNDQLDTSVLDRAFGQVEQVAGIPPAAPGQADIRCLGLRLDARQGVATVTALGIDSDALHLQATGTADLGQETYNILFQPGSAASVQLGGTFAQPLLTARPQTASTPQPGATRPPDICPLTLTLARLGQPGPAAPPVTGATAFPVSAPGSAPKNLLKTLLTP